MLQTDGQAQRLAGSIAWTALGELDKYEEAAWKTTRSDGFRADRTAGDVELTIWVKLSMLN